MLRTLFSFISILAICQWNGIAADFWPEFRGPTAQGVSTATNVPVNWSATSNVAWKVAIPGKGWSSPVLANGRVYLTTACEVAGNPGISLRVICLNAANGQIIWDVEAIQPNPSDLKPGHIKNSLASPTPIIHDTSLFVHFGHMGTACLNLNGKVLWRQQGVKYAPLHGNGGSPVLVDSELVFNCDGLDNPFVTALDAKTGNVKWKTPRDTSAKKKFSFATPLVVGHGASKQVISAGSGFVAGYAPVNWPRTLAVSLRQWLFGCSPACDVGRSAFHLFGV